MLLRNEAKVGLLVFVALVTLVAVYWFLAGLGTRASRYPIYAIFLDARKLDKGADVRMAGVKVGIVSGIHLTRDSRARVDLAIWNDTRIPADSVARITTGGFIGDNYIEILPGSDRVTLKGGQRISAAHIVQFDRILDDVGSLLTELKASVKGINQILGDEKMVRTVKETVVALSKAAQSASEVVTSASGILDQASPDVRRVFANLADATDQAVALSREINDMVARDARPALRSTVAQVGDVVSNLNRSIVQAQTLLGSFQTSAGKVDEALTQVTAVACEAQETMSKLNEAAGGVRDLATDSELQENLKATARNTAAASEQARDLLTGLNRRFGGGGDRPTPAQKSAIPDYGASVNALWNTGTGNYRVDANYTLAGRDNGLYRVGAYDIGESTKLNLQLGRLLGHGDAFRYGLYASRLGVGYDRRLSGRLRVGADLFRPNDPNLELRAVFGINDQWGLYGGVLDVIDKDRRDVLLGVQYRK